MKEEKTNVMRLLDGKKIPYIIRNYLSSGAISGTDAADALGLPYEKVFKTLVTVGKTNAHYVFDIPVDKELDLKKAAAAVGEKNVSMLKSKELLPLTGYIHGGCSPIGMKKKYPTFVDETAMLFDAVAVSAGQRGVQVMLNPDDLLKAAQAKYESLTRD